MYGSATSDVTNPATFSRHLDRQVLPTKYNLIAMAMAAATATEPPAVSTASTVPETTASASKCGGSHSVFSIILVSIARFVFSS